MKSHIQGHESKMIKCITFDLDDTLWAVNPVVRAANITMYTWLNENAPLFNHRYALSDLNALRQDVVSQCPEIGYSVTKVRLAVLELGLCRAGYEAEQAKWLAEQAFQVFHRARQEVEFFEHALAVVESLKASGYIVGAISNGNADITQVGLSHCMDFQFSADQVGVEKPDPLIFKHMLDYTKLKPEEVIHIGDHPEHDIAGAKSAGLWNIWVNFGGKQDSTVAADAVVKCLSDIPAAVEKINAQRRVRL